MALPKKYMGLLGKFAESLDYNDLPKDWADNPEIVKAAGELWKKQGTDSPFFKAWFGNSKVVDEAGKPLTTYHQTDQNFDTFDLSKARQNSDIPAFFFSSGTEDWADMGGHTIPAYLRIQNPTSKPPVYGRGREVRDGLEKKGYDGTIEAEDGLETEYAAFNPTQVKSTANRGTFNPDDPNIYKGLLPLIAAGGAAAAMSPDEAEAAVYSKDGRRMLNLLDNASKGALSGNEPIFEFQERLPGDIFRAAKEDNEAFNTRKLAADRNDIQHYWNARHSHMSNEQIEDLIGSLVAGEGRFYIRANKPYAESVGVLGNTTGGRGALRPSVDFTYLHQVNPLNNKRLLNMKNRSVETPDGSAFHPNTSHSQEGGATQRAISADSVSEDNKKFIESFLGVPPLSISGLRNNPASAQPLGFSVDRKLSDNFTVPGTPSFDKEKMAVLAVPASAWASTPVDMSPTMFDRVMRDMGIGARGVMEGLGTGATLGMGNPGRYVADWLNLPEARTETEKRRKGTVQGIADAVPMIAGGAGAARVALSPVVRGVGASLASTPKTDAALGGLLGYFMGGD